MKGIFLFKAAILISSIISSVLALYVFNRRKTSRPLRYYSGLMFANAVYATSYLLEIHMPELTKAVLCLNFEYIGLSFIPVFWVLIAWSYNTREFGKDIRTEKRLLFLLVIPVIIILFIWTNPLHHFIYKNIFLLKGLPLTVLQFDRAPVFWVLNGTLVVLHLSGTIRMIYNIFYARGRFRGQFVLLASAAVMPSVAHVLLLMQRIPYNLDIVPIAFAFAGLLLFWGMIRIQLFDLLPIARDMVVNAMEDAVFVLDTKNRLIESNQSAKNLFIHDDTGGPGRPLELLNPLLWQKLSVLSGSNEIAVNVDNSERIFKTSKSPIIHNIYGTMGILYILHDITEIKSNIKRLEKLASFDDLTGLFNRRHFMKLAAMEVSRIERYKGYFSLIIFDLDHFKTINDKYGHCAGDATLQMIGRLVQENMRSGDLYARYGGEEFILLFRETTPEQADNSIERLRRAIEQATVRYEDNDIHITASFGISFYQSNTGTTLDMCLKQADEAMYEAKRCGRNRLFYYKQND